jgi:peptide-methionine (R)-S-oxide reductase
MPDIPKTDDEWRKKLTDEEYRILREKGTDVPYTGKEILDEKRNGVFTCKGCGKALFPSTAKFESGTGWPSFDQALPDAVQFIPDESFGMKRMEVVCSTCKSHLGHIFDDGPTENGKRYCINSTCLGFEEK